MIEPHCQMTAETVAEQDMVLCVGDTTFLDYGSIEAKKEGYGPIGKGGNGLILHSALAMNGTKKSSKVCRIRVTAFDARERSNYWHK
ncbi:hypothetical protein [Nostoc sp.]